jgi:hypothetical protein
MTLRTMNPLKAMLMDRIGRGKKGAVAASAKERAAGKSKDLAAEGKAIRAAGGKPRGDED